MKKLHQVFVQGRILPILATFDEERELRESGPWLTFPDGHGRTHRILKMNLVRICTKNQPLEAGESTTLLPGANAVDRL